MVAVHKYPQALCHLLSSAIDGWTYLSSILRPHQEHLLMIKSKELQSIWEND